MNENFESEVIVDIIRDIFGKEKHYYQSKGQISVNCPYCDDGKSKGNLEINIYDHVYKCWSCSETSGTHGVLGKLIDNFGTKDQKKTYEMFRPEEHKQREREYHKIYLPKEFTLFKDINPNYPPHKQALNYVRSRGITDDIIEKYNIGFASDGEYAGRIIVPSYNLEDELNYFVSRAWFNTKTKYKNPEAEKQKIIFNERLIDWTKPIYICEGVFDGMFVPNPVILLGKIMYDLLFESIYTKAESDIIICLDEDAWENTKKLYNTLNGGKLRGRVKVIKPPKGKDVADLRGNINDYFYQMNY